MRTPVDQDRIKARPVILQPPQQLRKKMRLREGVTLALMGLVMMATWVWMLAV